MQQARARVLRLCGAAAGPGVANRQSLAVGKSSLSADASWARCAWVRMGVWRTALASHTASGMHHISYWRHGVRLLGACFAAACLRRGVLHMTLVVVLAMLACVCGRQFGSGCTVWPKRSLRCADSVVESRCRRPGGSDGFCGAHVLRCCWDFVSYAPHPVAVAS